MSTPVDCCNPCTTLPPVNIPGTDGAPGAAGSPGTNGINAFSFVTAPGFNVPVALANVDVPVTTNAWMAIGQNVVVEGPANFKVISKTGTASVELQWLDYAGDVATGTPIAAGAQISPSGIQGPVDDPLLIANGGTSASTKAGAQVNFGLGQDITQFSSEALAYDITNSYTLITGATFAVPATGLYLVQARVTVLYTGVTFAASRVLSMRVRDTTSVVTLSEALRATNILTTLNLPSFDYVLPVKAVLLTAADVLELQAMLDTVESAGSSVITAVSMSITPLALS